MAAIGSDAEHTENLRTHGRKRKCYVSAPMDANLSTIMSLLEERGIMMLAPAHIAQAGTSLLPQVAKAISQADFMIAVLASHVSPFSEGVSSSVLFDLGQAYALGKRILILAPPSLKDLPVEVSELLYLRAEANNRESIAFGLDQLLAAPIRKRRKSTKPVAKSQPIGCRANELIERLEALGDQASEQDIEDIVVTALRASGVEAVVASDRSEHGLDLAIWSDDLERWVGNPLVVEIKKRLNQQLVNTTLGQIWQYLEHSGSRWALLLYVEGLHESNYPLSSSWPNHNVLVLRLGDLLARLRNESFGDIIRASRNQQVHGRST